MERVWNILFEYLVTGQWNEAWDREVATLAATLGEDRQLAGLPTPEFVRANPLLDSVPRLGRDPVAGAKSYFPDRRPDMGYDPIPRIEQLRCPVLIVLAEHDANLPMSLSLPRFEALAARPRTDRTVRVLPGADHLFSRRPTSEREDPEVLRRPRDRSEFASGYMELMAGWLSDRATLKTRT